MIELLVAGVLAAAYTPTDTTLTLRRGDVVVVERLSGELLIRAWDSSDLQVRGDIDDRAGVVVRRQGARVVIEPDDRKGRRNSRDIVMRVPAWADIEIRGGELEVDIDGGSGSLDVTTIDGEVSVVRRTGPVSVRTVEGEISIVDVRGTVLARSRGDDITLREVTGDVEVESGSGDIVLDRIEARALRAETLDGDIAFEGALLNGGHYGFFVHDGDAVIALPAGVGANVSVSTFDGEFTSEFPVRVERFSGGRAFDFVLGDGSATLQVEVFDGEIRFLRRR